MAGVDGKDVGSALVEALGSQADILSSLSLAVIGGLFAFAIQVMLHNVSEPEKRISVSVLSTWWVAIGFESLSLAFSYLLKGSIVSAIPTIYGSSYLVGQSIEKNAIEALDALRWLALGSVDI